MVKVGDVVKEFVDSFGRHLKGKVIYVHPENRYYTVEFESEGEKFRECFTEIKYPYRR